jgi:transcriptional regulator with XRE-family HTH domain
MPRRGTPDPLAQAVGARIRQLRQEAGLTIEKLAYESELGSKGHLSTLEKGLARPTVQTLQVIADRLEVKLLDLVTFPDEDDRAKLIDRTREMSAAEIRRMLKGRKK